MSRLCLRQIPTWSLNLTYGSEGEVKLQTMTDSNPLLPSKNSPDLHQSKKRPLAKVGWTCPPQSTPWRSPWISDLAPGLPSVTYFEYNTLSSRRPYRALCSFDVIFKPEVHNVSQHGDRTVVTATCNEHLTKFKRPVFEIC